MHHVHNYPEAQENSLVVSIFESPDFYILVMADVGVDWSLATSLQVDVTLRSNMLGWLFRNAYSRPFQLVYLMTQAC